MPSIWRIWRRGGAAAALALAAGIAPAGAQTAGDTACRAALAGTYLATIQSEAGGFASRALVTIHGDGTFGVIDSRQHQGVQGTSFSAQQGAYRCTSAGAARGTTLDFGYPPQETIARSDWTIAYDAATKSIAGTIALVIHPGVEKADPFAQGGKRIGTFRFTSLRVAPPTD